MEWKDALEQLAEQFPDATPAELEAKCQQLADQGEAAWEAQQEEI